MLPVVCTDRDTHPARQLGWLRLMDSGTVYFEPWGRPSDDLSPQDGTLQPAPCPTCRRTVPLRQETAAKVVGALTAAEIPRFDISFM